MPWGLATAAVEIGGSLYAANQNANDTRGAANSMAAATQYRPAGVATGLGLSQIDPTTGRAGFSLNNNFAQSQDQSIGNSNVFGGMLAGLAPTGGLDQNALGAGAQYNQTTQANNGLLTNPTQQAFGALGSFDPNQAAAGYTAQLNAAAARGDQTAAQGEAQRLFNTGSLGTTGGQGMFQTLMDSQAQAQTGRNIAGMQYGQQAQNNLLQQALGLNNTVNDRAQSRLSSQMGLLGFGQNNLASLSNLQGNQLQQSLGVNSAGLNQLGIGSQIGSAQSAGGIGAMNGAGIQVGGQIAQNNAYNSMFQTALSTGMDAYRQSRAPQTVTEPNYNG